MPTMAPLANSRAQGGGAKPPSHDSCARPSTNVYNGWFSESPHYFGCRQACLASLSESGIRVFGDIGACGSRFWLPPRILSVALLPRKSTSRRADMEARQAAPCETFQVVKRKRHALRACALGHAVRTLGRSPTCDHGARGRCMTVAPHAGPVAPTVTLDKPWP